MEACVVPSFLAAATWEKLKFSIRLLATKERKAGRTDRTTTSHGGRNCNHRSITALFTYKVSVGSKGKEICSVLGIHVKNE